MKDYQIWDFNYLSFGSDGINVITGNKEESSEDFSIPCFNGVAYFKAKGKCYVARYPKVSELTAEQMDRVEKYCGYEPENDEFGVVMGALGEIKRVCVRDYYLVAAAHPVECYDRKKVNI